MHPIRTFNVSPSLPPRLEPLRKLAHNLYWDWNVEAKELFRRLDHDLWDASRHNPVLMLGTISQDRLREVTEDEGFLAQMDRAARQLQDYLADRVTDEVNRTPNWYHRQRPRQQDCYAYFSAEFGLVDCLPIYSGGLGVLAGDHLKSASDLGLPLVGVGLLYQKGYFSQHLGADGWQQENYPVNDFYNMPLHQEFQAEGKELRISLDLPGRQVHARVWRVQVGNVPLYLLDTNLPENNPYDQDITDQLYGGDLDMRIHQEIVLGIGGVKMLRALGLNVTAYHMNEGHSAFLSLERIRHMIQEEGLRFHEALQVAKASQLFTTHTPVPAGIDLFPPDKIMYYLGHYAETFGLTREEFLALGRARSGDTAAPFSMAILAIQMASFINGVSRLHGHVSRDMFQELWPGLPVPEVPITSITNGVHARSCVAKSTQDLYDRYLGPNWSEVLPENPLWERIKSIPDEELWRNHERCRLELVLFIREHLKRRLRERGASPAEILQAQEVLDPSVLTIGFARRFATYKRANLFLRDLDRIKRIILDFHKERFKGGMLEGKKRLVQFVFAGKAHPMDVPGKELIRDIIRFIREEGMRHSVVFIADYDIHVNRLMVAGCDVWLNNPRRPREASGTSGMKASMNGLPNLSVLDGWWDEADYIRTGWSIGHGEDYQDQEYQDTIEANALYDLLEQEVIPLFYSRDPEGLPRGWIAKMKDAIQLNCPHFNTARMVGEYAQRGYFPASDRCQQMRADQHAAARGLAQWKTYVSQHWREVKITSVDVAVGNVHQPTANYPAEVQVNQSIAVTAHVSLGALQPADVRVELYQGALGTNTEIVAGSVVRMEYKGQTDHGELVYSVQITYANSGLQGFSLRVLPCDQRLSNPYEMGLVTWAEG